MELRKRENNGIKTPQQRNIDFFVLSEIGANLLTGMAFCEIQFFEHSDDALNGLPANAQRRLEWLIIDATDVTSGTDKVLTFEDVLTTSNDLISLSGSTLV
jgi:hypothetical protein